MCRDATRTRVRLTCPNPALYGVRGAVEEDGAGVPTMELTAREQALFADDF